MSIQPPPPKRFVTVPLPHKPPRQPRQRARWLALAGLTAVVAAIALVLLVTHDNGRAPRPAPATPTATANETPTPEPAAALPGFSTFRIGPFTAELPSGSGWGHPRDSEPTPGRLFRTTVRGPGGAFVLVDFTPHDPARFSGDYYSRHRLPQPAFESAVAYIFTNSQLDGCADSRCIDYILNRRSTGYAVLAGGPDFELARAVALHVARSLVPAEETSVKPNATPRPAPNPTEAAGTYTQTCTVKAWYTESPFSADFGYIHFKCVDDSKHTTVSEALGSDNFSFRDEQAAAKRTPKRERLVAALRSKLEAAGWTHMGILKGGEWYQDRYGR